MRNSGLRIPAVLWVAVLSAVLPFASCERYDDGATGELRVSFSDAYVESTRSLTNVPDTSDFNLKITDAGGGVVYEGKYGACPESVMVGEGSYVITVVSSDFKAPAFDMPQFGDEQCVVVAAGGVTDVKLICRQMNAGVRLDIDGSFLEGCPDGVLRLKSADGALTYSYREERIAYFNPGAVSLVLSRGGSDKVLMTRRLERQQVMVIGVSVAVEKSEEAVSSGEMSVSVDTSRVWLSEEYVIGGQTGKGLSIDNALTVAQAVSVGEKNGVWVSGYVVGGDLTSSAASFSGPFSSRTNLLLGPKSGTVDRNACIAVQLPSGKVRDALNLVDNQSVLGRKVCLKGNLSSPYFGLTGLKSVTEYQFQ